MVFYQSWHIIIQVIVIKLDQSEPIKIFFIALASLQVFVIVRHGFLKTPSFGVVNVILKINLELTSMEFEINLSVFN